MFNSRKELYQRAKEMYVSLMTRAAQRYYNKEIYVVSDYVSFSCTQIEEIFRPLWGIAPFLKNDDINITVSGKVISVADFLTDVMLEGTNPESDRFFNKDVSDDIQVKTFANQSITEIAAWLIAVHFAPEKLWNPIPQPQKDRIALWIREWAIVAVKDSWKNNHYWYPIYCLEILKQLGYDCSMADEAMEKGYAFLETLYHDKGWYSDGEFGRFDYYQAWAHHTYTLLWIMIADKQHPGYAEKCNKYRERSTAFLNFFQHYFDSDGGMVAYGRSIGYRFAAIAPFGLAALTGCDVNPGLAQRMILKNIGYFFEKSIPTEDGVFPVGYLYNAPGSGENYSSDGAISCYTEGFLCLLADENHPLWNSPEVNLPIEQGNYCLPCPLETVQIVLTGNDAKNGVCLYNNSIHYYQSKFFAHRFNDMAGAYSKFVYNSRSGFGLSTADNVSVDNMISLYTPDGTMSSHRKRMLNPQVEDGVLISAHIPFSNDEKTSITTWVVPLKNGYHVRVHKVILAQKYIVREGGFSIGVTDDCYTVTGDTVRWQNMISTIHTLSDCKPSYCAAKIHPGMHLLKPQALYPSYVTDVLEAGEYIFATTVYFATDGIIEKPPVIQRVGDEITIEQGAIVKHIILKEKTK